MTGRPMSRRRRRAGTRARAPARRRRRGRACASWPEVAQQLGEQPPASALSSTTRTRAPPAGAPRARRLGAGGVAGGLRGSSRRDRQLDDELAAAPGPLAAGGDRAAVHLDQAAHDGQPQAQAALASDRATGAPGRTGRRRGRAARAGCPMPSSRTVSGPARRRARAAHVRSRARVAVLRGVGQQVGDDLRQPVRVGVTRQPLRRDVQTQLAAGAARAAGAPSRCPARHGRAELHALAPQLDLAARDARDVQQVVDQPHQVPDLALDDRPARASRRPRMRMSCSAVRIGASGLRSSCPSMARNSSLARLAVSATARAASASRLARPSSAACSSIFAAPGRSR